MTDKQQEANRANAQLSTGPTTPEGKETSSRNATKHGLTARRLVLTPDQKAEFTNLHESLLKSWNPVDAQESALVLHIAESQWRYETAQAALDQLMFSASAGFQAHKPGTPGEAANALAIQAHAKNLLLYQRYATGFERSMLRLIAALRQLQSFRIKKQQTEKDNQRLADDQQDSWEGWVEWAIKVGYDVRPNRLRRFTPDQLTRYNESLASFRKEQ
jgi:hypothetical protein